MNPSEVREQWLADAGNRLTPHPAFELSRDAFDFDRYFDITESHGSGLSKADLTDLVDPEVLSEVRAELPQGAQVRAMDADTGRGASGLGLALEIIGIVADVGGVAAVLVASAKTIKKIYDILTERMGRRPVVSLGAAKYLAADDLFKRTNSKDVELIGAGDVRDQVPDFAYTGEDHFYVIFQQGRQMYFYLVEPDGRARFVGSVERNPTPREKLMDEEE